MEQLVLFAVGALLVLAFVLAPLVRRKTDLKPIRRPHPGTRHLHGLDSEEVEIPDPGDRRCPHCGADVDEGYVYCGECSNPLP